MTKRYSLQTRLAWMYTGVAYIVLATIGLLLVAGIFSYITRPLAHEMSRAVQAITVKLATAPSGSRTDEIWRQIVLDAKANNIQVVAIPLNNLNDQTAQEPPGDINIGQLFNISPVFLETQSLAVVVLPARTKTDSIFRDLYVVAGIILLLALWLASLIGRIGARATLNPLLTVTAELERFGSGDFTPHWQRESPQKEFSALAVAFNGAALKVTEAFLERRRVEEQIRQFVAEAGHELRTPLTVVAGYVDVLRRGGDNNPATRTTALASLTVEVKRMRLLVERLMTLARLDSVHEAEPEVVDVAAIILQAIDALTLITRTSIAFEGAQDLLILGEPVDLYEIIANLLENAVKYGEGTPVSVTVSTLDATLLISVRDGGPGITETDRVRIFERFYRGTERGDIPGSGLGLSIAAKAAQRLGGRIELQDARPGSTSFALIVPILRVSA